MEATPSTTLLWQWWYESITIITVKRGTLGENLGLEIGAACKGKTWARIIFQVQINPSDSWPEDSLDWIALLSVRANSWLVIPEPQKTWCTQTIMLEQKQLTLLEILTPGNGWKIPGIAQVQRKLQWTICWLATTSSSWGLHVKRFSITDLVKS